MNKYLMLRRVWLAVVALSLCFGPVSNAQSNNDSNHRYSYWYCYSIGTAHPVYYSRFFRVKDKPAESVGSFYDVLYNAWGNYLVQNQGFTQKYGGLWKNFQDGQPEDNYDITCESRRTEQEANDRRAQISAERNQKIVQTGWAYSTDDDNQ
jgi:hypothetical protein